MPSPQRPLCDQNSLIFLIQLTNWQWKQDQINTFSSLFHRCVDFPVKLLAELSFRDFFSPIVNDFRRLKQKYYFRLTLETCMRWLSALRGTLLSPEIEEITLLKAKKTIVLNFSELRKPFGREVKRLEATKTSWVAFTQRSRVRWPGNLTNWTNISNK